MYISALVAGGAAEAAATQARVAGGAAEAAATLLEGDQITRVNDSDLSSATQVQGASASPGAGCHL